MQPEAVSARKNGVAAHPLAELLDCPPETGNLLNGAAQCLDFEAGAIVFRQLGICRGLYVVVSGLFLRRTERLEERLTLGPARAGELVELAAALGDGRHTYTLSAQTPGTALLLPSISGLSAAADAVAGGACAGSLTRLWRQLHESSDEEAARGRRSPVDVGQSPGGDGSSSVATRDAQGN